MSRKRAKSTFSRRFALVSAIAAWWLALPGCESSTLHLPDASQRLDVVFPIRESDKRWGAIRGDGTVLVEPTFDKVSYGFGSRLMGGAHQLVGQQGVLLTSPSSWCYVTADKAHRFKPVSNAHWRVYNLGEALFALEKRPTDRGYTAETRPAWAKWAAVHSFLVFDPFQKWQAPDDVLPVNRLTEGLVVVVRDGKFGYADRNGDVVVATTYEAADPFSEGLAEVMRDGKWGFIDRTGRMVIEPQFDIGSAFDNGLAMVAQHGRDHPFFINKSGEEVNEWPHEFPFENHVQFRLFSEGLWSRTDLETKLRGYSNPQGEWAISPGFKSASPFSEGLGAVQFADSGEFGYIDKTGDLRFTVPRASHLAPFDHGLAWVRRTGSAPHAGYINRDGQWVWPAAK